MSNTGGIKYSLGKNDIYYVLTTYIFVFLFFYYSIIIISHLFYYKLQWSQYIIRNNASQKNDIDNSILLFFQKITNNSLLLSYEKDGNYVGLTKESYIIIILMYTIALLILIGNLIKIFISSIIVQVIQINPNNNPYKNPNVITKNNISPYPDILSYYMGIACISLSFLVPFIIIYMLNYLNLDNYDIKKSTWIPYAILLLLLFPFIYIISQPYSPFSMVYKYIENKDKPWIDETEKKLRNQYFLLSILLFIIIFFCSYHIIYFSKYPLHMIYYGIFIYIILFILIPSICIFFSYQILTEGKDNGERKIDKINNVESFYELLIKYNYPCFSKE